MKNQELALQIKAHIKGSSELFYGAGADEENPRWWFISLGEYYEIALDLSPPNAKDKIYVHGLFEGLETKKLIPFSKKVDEYVIGVTRSRGVAAIVTDIRERLLDHYFYAYQLLAEAQGKALYTEEEEIEDDTGGEANRLNEDPAEALPANVLPFRRRTPK